MRHGGKILVDQLVKLGVRRVFSVPGESFLAVLDALYDSGIENIVCRQEGGAAMMAEAHAKLTGQPGVCFVTRGPGATNASAGVHVARQGSTPLIVFVGQIDSQQTDREAFQEVDYRAVFGGLTKWTAQVNHTARLPEYVARAFRTALSGRPGPVVLALPEDVLSARADVPDFTGIWRTPAAPDPVQWDHLLSRLSQAKQPLLIVGGPHWSAAAAAALQDFATAAALPVATAFRRQDYVDNRHPCFAGDLNVGLNPKLAQRVRDADCLLLLGTRFGDIETQGYSLVSPADPQKTILHIHAGAEEIGQVFGPDLAINCPADIAAVALRDAAARYDGWAGWPDQTAQASADYKAWQEPVASPGSIRQEEVIRWLTQNLPDDAIVTNGAGNYAAWLHRYFQWKQFGTQLAPTSGSMGYGFPAAIAAALEHPARTVVCLAGDGCFQMTCNEMSTAVQHGAKPIVIVMNNGRYGTIRMHQERYYPGRISGTDLANPDFAALAHAYGGFGVTVTDQADFVAAFAMAQAAGSVAIIECRLDPRALAPATSLPLAN